MSFSAPLLSGNYTAIQALTEVRDRQAKAVAAAKARNEPEKIVQNTLGVGFFPPYIGRAGRFHTSVASLREASVVTVITRTDKASPYACPVVIVSTPLNNAHDQYASRVEDTNAIHNYMVGQNDVEVHTGSSRTHYLRKPIARMHLEGEGKASKIVAVTTDGISFEY